MNKKLLLFIFIFVLMVIPRNIHALTPSEYENRHQCSNFELAGAHTDGTAVTVGCYNTYQEAKNAMVSIGAEDLIIFDERSTTKIVDSQYGLVDLTRTPNTLIYFYESSALNTRIYTSINPSGYGGSDAALIEINSSNYAAKVKIANFTGWISSDDYVIVPLNWVKSSSNYNVSNEVIKHNYVTDITINSSLLGRSLGPKPEMLNEGTYYSYDGHYFYTNRLQMIKDYKNNTFNNSVNKTQPYYNYYMYLSNHTKTTYSSVNIDEYTKNALGFQKDVYGDKASSGTSRLYGKGAFFYNTQQVYGVNALLSYSLSRNETGNGTSNLAINKNNGFGLDAVDSSPTESAKYYATFSSSIFGYATKWNSYGYSYATDWRYFGPAFGDKYNGMNVKYATDAYWSEKMASNYYNFDKYYGLNDYNYYQLGVVLKPTGAYFNANTSKLIYTYPEEEDQVVIVGESGDYYKVVSDMNIDSNGNLIGSKTDYNHPYRWDSSYVYVKKSDIKKINTAKNGYQDPSSVTNYKDSKYTYDLYVEDTVLKPKVAMLKQDTNYYYDSALTSLTGKKVLKDKWVMVYSAAYNANGEIVSYLITSDYMYDQKHWVSASTLKFITTGYGKQTVNISGAYEWVCSEPIDNEKYKIGGQYTNSYVPLITSKVVDGIAWYKVPVSLDSNTNSYGWLLASDVNAYVDLIMYYASNNDPVIVAKDQTVIQGSDFNSLEGVSAYDEEDGNLTDSIKVTGEVNTDVVGTYSLTYSVTDKDSATTTKTVVIKVVEASPPVINVEDKTIKINSKFDERKDVVATDFTGKDITESIKVIKNNVDTSKIDTYEVTYQVTDSNNKTTTKTIKVTVIDKVAKEGLYYFDSLKEVDGNLQIKGYHAIKGLNHTLEEEFKFYIILQNLKTGKRYEQEINRITDKSEITRPVYSTDGKDYTYSWFKGNINIDELDDGDYELYIVTKNSDYYAETKINNKVLKEQVAEYTSEKTVITRNNYRDSNMPLQFIVRSKKISDKTANSVYNQYTQYRTFAFENNKLHIKGTAYSYGMNLAPSQDVKRQIIFENQNDYKTYSYNLDSITDGMYTVGSTLGDNLDKTRAWFDKSIDITNIPEGVYTIFIATQSNVKDYSELDELLQRDLSDVVLKLDKKTYSFTVNSKERYRVEMTVKGA